MEWILVHSKEFPDHYAIRYDTSINERNKYIYHPQNCAANIGSNTSSTQTSLTMTMTNQNRYTPAFRQHGFFAPHLGVIQKKVATHCSQEFDSISWKLAEHFSFVLSLISLEFLISRTFSHLDYSLLTITISQFGKNGQED